jgi:hypothetical protein
MFFLFSLSSLAQTDKDYVYLTGKIINEVQITQGKNNATVIEFEIIKFSDPSYTQKNIGVVTCCPDIKEFGFYSTGKIYEVKLRPNKSEENYFIANRSELEKYNLKENLWIYSMEEVE